ncbi:MlaD family protein [Nocardia cyriacigeorgica]|uniref:MlaD family protein n=1 Tax=Nocardia cyriacigeorgica TaxID=135487 RepID=UPI0024582841|nr:MlaD family protein [Nocardia cyriacigeorgica]
MSGVTANRRSARAIGIGAIAAAVAIAFVCQSGGRDDEGRVRVVLMAGEVGSGVGPGSAVRVDGVDVGSVRTVEPIGLGRQRIELSLDRPGLVGLTDRLSVNYTAGNLFGISEIDLVRGSGGRPIGHDSVVDLTEAGAPRTFDATLSTLLQAMGELTGQVFTPRFAADFGRLAGEIQAFVPLLRTLVVVGEAIADNHRIDSSVLLDDLGSAISGLSSTTDGVMQMMKVFDDVEYTKNPANLEKLVTMMAGLRDDVLPGLTALLKTTESQFGDHVELFVPFVTALGNTLGDPDRAGADLRALMDRLDRSFYGSDTGPVIRVELALSGVPGLAVPLLGGGAGAQSKGNP